MRTERKNVGRRLAALARHRDVSRRLMTTPGVGPVISLAFMATVGDPDRFEKSKAIGAHLGLTPRIYQSGEIDRSGQISVRLVIRKTRILAADRGLTWPTSTRRQSHAAS